MFNTFLFMHSSLQKRIGTFLKYLMGFFVKLVYCFTLNITFTFCFILFFCLLHINNLKYFLFYCFASL